MNQQVPAYTLDGPVIVGAGLAGLATAIELSPVPCLVLSAGPLGTGTSTGWAQGGVASAVDPDDSAALHAADTYAAGAGLCEPNAVEPIVEAGPATIDWMARVGARFDRNPDGSWMVGLEGAHSRWRVVHAQGDGTGAELLRAGLAKVAELDSVTVWDNAVASDLLVREGRIVGVRVELVEGPVIVHTNHVVIATGGVGGLFQHTTNPLSSRGSGLALAARAGAVLRDVEMVQFHPTALHVGIDPMPLVSEAVRGEGALVVNETGARVIDNPLSARDVVSRAEWAALQAGHQVFLDARINPGPRFKERFPGISEILDEAGLDPLTDLLPIHPAAHYHMGGILVDGHGRSTVPGLYAVGEASSTGLHGANRLASNSLLEAMVCGRWVANEVRDHVGMSTLRGVTSVGTTLAQPARPVATPADVAAVRAIMSQFLGVLRDEAGLTEALTQLHPYRHLDEGLVGCLIATTALQRRESRGGHWRTDYPESAPVAQHTLIDITALTHDAFSLAS